MKSRTSYFNPTVFRKNLTRFAPAWGLYTLCLLLGLILIMDSGYRHMPGNMTACIQIMSVITPCYAFLLAQLLFGDLYNTRMCNALHAMPIRREGWYFTNLVSALVMHLIPTVTMGTLATILMILGAHPMGWVTGPLWILSVNLQFVCFFGIGMLSVMCVGSRFAMAVVYGILNFGSVIAGWLVYTLCEPMMFGIKTDMDPFLRFCPIGYLIENDVARIQRVEVEPNYYIEAGALVFESGWGYLWICAAAGIGMMALALMLYRRRKLESAGDFMAVKVLEPVFLTVYTLCVGAAFQFVMCDMFGMGTMIFLFVGLVVGYFTGRMLVKRTVRVFSLKEFLRCGAVLLVVCMTLAVVAWDPFGRETWIPEPEAVKSVTVSDGHYEFHDCEITLKEPEEIRKVLELHQEALDYRIKDNMVAVETATEEMVTVETLDAEEFKQKQEEHRTVPFTMEYKLKDGRVVTRYYYVWNYTEGGQALKHWFSSMECVFDGITGLDELMKIHKNAYMDCYYSKEDAQTHFVGEDLRTLFEAIMADCEAGTMAQDWAFHQKDEIAGWFYFGGDVEVMVYTNNENVLKWMGEHGVDVEKLLEERGR